MNKLILCATLALLTATTASVEAKDKKKGKYKDRDEEWRKSSAHYDNRDHDDDRYRDSDRDRSRTIYVIERERPVKRVVYIDSDGRYYQRNKGQRVYVRERYYESYPSRYYTSSGQRRVSVTLPF